MTLFGSHTADELRDLVKAKDYDVSQVQAAYDAFAPTWRAQDAAGAADWLTDWNAFRKRYEIARAKATVALTAADLVLGPDSLKPVEGPWTAILRALTVTDGVQSKGDFQELHNRFVAAQGKPVDFSKQPTPIAVDTDLKAYQRVDTGIRAGEAAASQAGKAAEKAGGDFLRGNWPWILAGVVALGAGHAIVKKVI